MEEQSPPSNGKALVAVVLGAFAFANVLVFAVLLVVDVEALDNSGAWWMLLPFFGLTCGAVAAFLGSIGWIDVRRGVTDRRLREAQAGAILGGAAAGLLVIGFIVLVVVFIVLMIAFGGDGSGIS